MDKTIVLQSRTVVQQILLNVRSFSIYILSKMKRFLIFLSQYMELKKRIIIGEKVICEIFCSIETNSSNIVIQFAIHLTIYIGRNFTLFPLNTSGSRQPSYMQRKIKHNSCLYLFEMWNVQSNHNCDLINNAGPDKLSLCVNTI